MPQRPPKLGTFPVSLRDYQIENPVIHEMLMNYDDGDLYVVNDKGELISLSKDIFMYIVSSRIQNINLVSVSAPDKSIPSPPINERKYNWWYLCVEKERDM